MCEIKYLFTAPPPLALPLLMVEIKEGACGKQRVRVESAHAGMLHQDLHGLLWFEQGGGGTEDQGDAFGGD